MYAIREGLNLIPNSSDIVGKDDLRQEIFQRMSLAATLSEWMGGPGIIFGGAHVLTDLQDSNTTYPKACIIVNDDGQPPTNPPESWFFFIDDHAPIDFSNYASGNSGALYACIELNTNYVTPAAIGGRHNITLKVYQQGTSVSNAVLLGTGKVVGSAFNTNFAGTNFIGPTITGGGTDKEILFNQNGSVSGSANLTFDSGSNLLSTTNLSVQSSYVGNSYNINTNITSLVDANHRSSADTYALQAINTRSLYHVGDTVGNVYGFLASAVCSASSPCPTVPTMVGAQVCTQVNGLNAVVSEKILEISQLGSSTSRTNVYGIYVNSIERGSNIWGIFLEGSGNCGSIGWSMDGARIYQSSATTDGYPITINCNAYVTGKLMLGDGVGGDIAIEAVAQNETRPRIRYNETSSKWELSNDGSIFHEIATVP